LKKSHIIIFLTFIHIILYSSEVTIIDIINKGKIIYPELSRKINELNQAYLKEEEVKLKKLPDINFNIYMNYLPEIYKEDRNKNGMAEFYINTDKWTPFLNPNITIVFPIYTFGKISKGEEAAKYNIELKKAEVEETEAFVEYQAKKIFWGYLLVKSIIDYVLSDTIKKYEKIVDDKKKSFEKGKITRSSLENSIINYYNLKINESEAYKNYNEAKTWIDIIVGNKNEEIITNPKIIVPLKFDIKSFAYYLDIAKGNYYGFKKIQYGYLARKAYADYEKASLLPDIFIATNINYIYHNFNESVKDTILPDKTFDFYFALGLRWNLSLWNKYNQKQQIETRFLADLENIKMGYKYNEINLRKAYDNVIDKMKKLTYKKEQYKATKRWVILSINAYEAGTGNPDDAQNGLVEFFTKKKDYYYAIYEFNIAIAEFEMLLGINIVDYKNIRDEDIED